MSNITLSRLVLNMRAITVGEDSETEPELQSMLPLSPPRRKPSLFTYLPKRKDSQDVNPGSSGSTRTVTSSTPWDAYEMYATEGTRTRTMR